MEWSDEDPGVEFHPSTGELFRILRQSGFTVRDVIEVYAPSDATDHPYYSSISAEWGRRWAPEEIWRAQRL